MKRAEIAFAKSDALTTRDWDAYQAILRKCLRVSKPPRPETRRQGKPDKT